MASRLKKIAGAKEVILRDGSAAILVVFSNDDHTPWPAQGQQQIGKIEFRAGETIVVSDEDRSDIFDVGTVH
jgi:hypothetical protein